MRFEEVNEIIINNRKSGSYYVITYVQPDNHGFQWYSGDLLIDFINWDIDKFRLSDFERYHQEYHYNYHLRMARKTQRACDLIPPQRLLLISNKDKFIYCYISKLLDIFYTDIGKFSYLVYDRLCQTRNCKVNIVSEHTNLNIDDIPKTFERLISAQILFNRAEIINNNGGDDEDLFIDKSLDKKTYFKDNMSAILQYYMLHNRDFADLENLYKAIISIVKWDYYLIKEFFLKYKQQKNIEYKNAGNEQKIAEDYEKLIGMVKQIIINHPKEVGWHDGHQVCKVIDPLQLLILDFSLSFYNLYPKEHTFSKYKIEERTVIHCKNCGIYFFRFGNSKKCEKCDNNTSFSADIQRLEKRVIDRYRQQKYRKNDKTTNDEYKNLKEDIKNWKHWINIGDKTIKEYETWLNERP